jgi:spermidine/putrescine transport system ATP-binding protein
MLDGVAKSFGDVPAVDDVSLQVSPGRFFSLLGPSGCGKTTTLRMIAGFERVDGGRILIEGTDITTLAPNLRPVNTVFQHYALFPHMTVEDNVAYGLRQKKLDKGVLSERLSRAVQMVRLEEFRTRYPRQLSGGQQQRVALARALINEPTVLLLDEPLAALDLKLRKAMQQELKMLQERVGITFVYVTHDQEEALTLSDRIAVMNRGRILQEGSPSEIYERPRSRFVADFIGQTNFFEGVVETAGDRVIVRTPSGSIRGQATHPVSAGQNVVVSVRPEAIREKTEASANHLAGTLARVTYLGDLIQYHLELPGSGELVFQRQNEPNAMGHNWRVGERVEVAFDEESALVVVDDEVAADADRRGVEEKVGRG